MKIAFLGDLGFFGKMNLDNNDSLFEYFKPMHEYLAEFDLVVANLETPIVNPSFKVYGSKSAYISTTESSIKLLKYLNIGAVTLANNHTFDFGRKGLDNTKKILSQNNINYFGVDGIDYLHYDSGVKIAFQGYCCYSTNSYGLSKRGSRRGIHSLEYNSIEKRLKKYGEMGYINIICPHIGEEHVNIPNVHHINFFRKLCENNRFVMVGHHPHVVQGVEKIDNSILAYSLGNFCFDDVYVDIQKDPLIKLSDNNRTSMVFTLELENKQIQYRVRHFYFKQTINFLIDNPVFLDACKILNQDVAIIKAKRRHLLNEYLHSRKTNRDLSWYFKRLKLKYVFMILRARFNAKMFHKNVINPLS